MSELEVRHVGRTTIFTIHRPGRRNAINSAFADAFHERFAEFDASEQRVAIITGGGNHFSGGSDIDDRPTHWKLSLTTDKPVISAVHGACVGGALIWASLCDLCVASECATFHYPEARVGMTGGVAATLAARIPTKFAMEIMFLARPFTAQRAFEMGLVNCVTPEGAHLETALEMAADLETMAPLVLSTLKRFVNQHVLPQSPSQQMAWTMREIAKINESKDLAEGLAAVRAGRSAVFEGH